MNKIKKLKGQIEETEFLPVMFNGATYLLREEIMQNGKTIDIDFDWDLRRVITVDDYATKEFFISSTYFRPLSKYKNK